MNRILLIFLLLFTTVSTFNCSTEVTGGTTSTENGKVAGVVIDELDSLVANCEVILIPDDFNPLVDSTNLFYIDTTDDFGHYLFDPVKNGNYNLICQDSNMSILVDVNVNGDSIVIEDQVIKPVSNLSIKVSGDMPFMNIAYFQGTPFVAEYDSVDSIFHFDALPHGMMPQLIIQNQESDEIIKDSIVTSSGQVQSIEIDTNSFLVDNRIIGSGALLSIGASPFKIWAGFVAGGLYYSQKGDWWLKTDTGASPWLEDSILDIEANEYYEKDWALIKTKFGTLFYGEGTYWSVEDQLYPNVKGEIPSSMLISDSGEIILSYSGRTIIGEYISIGDTLVDFEWKSILSGEYEYLTGTSDSLYMVKNGTEIYRRFGEQIPYLYYTMKDSITGLSMIDKDLYIGCINGYYRYDFETDSLFMISTEINIDNVRSIVKVGDGSVCALVGNRSIFYYDGIEKLIYTPNIDSTSTFIDMTFRNKNQLWISAGDKGVYTVQPVN